MQESRSTPNGWRQEPLQCVRNLVHILNAYKSSQVGVGVAASRTSLFLLRLCAGLQKKYKKIRRIKQRYIFYFSISYADHTQHINAWSSKLKVLGLLSCLMCHNIWVSSKHLWALINVDFVIWERRITYLKFLLLLQNFYQVVGPIVWIGYNFVESHRSQSVAR